MYDIFSILRWDTSGLQKFQHKYTDQRMPKIRGMTQTFVNNRKNKVAFQNH